MEKRRWEEDEFIGQLGLLFEGSGYVRMAGRIFGLLLLGASSAPTMEDIASRLGASKSSISTSLRLLLQLKLVDRVSVAGKRPLCYRVRPGGWTDAFEDRLLAVSGARRLIAKGLDLLREETAERRAPLQEMDDMYAFTEAELPRMFARWRAARGTRRDEKSGKR